MPKEKNSVVSIAGLVKKKNAPIINHIITIPATIVRKVFLDILYSLCIYIREVQMKVAEVFGGGGYFRKYATTPFANIASATEFRTIKERSFHSTATHNQPVMPIK